MVGHGLQAKKSKQDKTRVEHLLCSCPAVLRKLARSEHISDDTLVSFGPYIQSELFD